MESVFGSVWIRQHVVIFGDAYRDLFKDMRENGSESKSSFICRNDYMHWWSFHFEMRTDVCLKHLLSINRYKNMKKCVRWGGLKTKAPYVIELLFIIPLYIFSVGMHLWRFNIAHHKYQPFKWRFLNLFTFYSQFSFFSHERITALLGKREKMKHSKSRTEYPQKIENMDFASIFGILIMLWLFNNVYVIYEAFEFVGHKFSI